LTSTLPTSLDIEASLKAMDRQNAGCAIKIWEDLERYQAVIGSSRPEVVVECGTWFGGSARWFAERSVDVITVDNEHRVSFGGSSDRITWMLGDTADDVTMRRVKRAVDGRRAMVVLDSDHRPDHVRREIELYGPLVSPGCYLVVEDTILRYVPSPFASVNTVGPLDAVEDMLADNPAWQRDEQIEALHPVSMSPAGWWVKREVPSRDD
jgi:cephalosporin hydroxylase